MLFKRYRELYRDRCKSATWNIQHGLKTGKKSAYISIEHWFKKETNRKGTENVTPHFISEICGFEIANCCFVIVIYISRDMHRVDELLCYRKRKIADIA